MDSILSLLQRAGAPPVFSRVVMDKLAEQAYLPPVLFPDPSFTCARRDQNGRRMPQAIAHRGYKAKYPENTLCAFRAAVDAGVHGLETDVHISRDKTVVLSHDPSLQRCFGVNQRIGNCDWDYLRTVRTLAEPHEPLPRLKDLLEYMAEPGTESIWLLLDIKMSNDADEIMRLMSEVVRAVPPPKGTKWEDRIVLGCWAAKFIPFCNEHFPGFPVSNIGFSLAYSRQFLAVPNTSFNMLQASLVSPSGRKLISDAKSNQRRVYSWTVNDEKNMDWCIRKGLDGVITDDPRKYLDVCDKFAEELIPAWPPMLVLNFIRINIFAFIFGILFWQRYGFGLDKRYTVDKSR